MVLNTLLVAARNLKLFGVNAVLMGISRNLGTITTKYMHVFQVREDQRPWLTGVLQSQSLARSPWRRCQFMSGLVLETSRKLFVEFVLGESLLLHGGACDTGACMAFQKITTNRATSTGELVTPTPTE